MRILFLTIFVLFFYKGIKAQENIEDCDAFKTVKFKYLCNINKNLLSLNRKNEDILSVLRSMNGDEKKPYRVKDNNSSAEPFPPPKS